MAGDYWAAALPSHDHRRTKKPIRTTYTRCGSVYFGAAVVLLIGPAIGLPESVMRDVNGFVLSGRDLRVEGELPRIWKEGREPYLLETSTPGVFVAGDVRHGSVKRAASAVGEGSIAVQFVHQYLARF